MIVVNIASSLLITASPRRPRDSLGALAILTATAIIFRAELLLFLAPWALQLLLTGNNSFVSVVVTGTISAVAAICRSNTRPFSKLV